MKIVYLDSSMIDDRKYEKGYFSQIFVFPLFIKFILHEFNVRTLWVQVVYISIFTAPHLALNGLKMIENKNY